MTSRTASLATIAAVAAVLLTACSSGEDSTDKPAAKPDPTAQITKTAKAYVTAWFDSKPMDAKTMCELQTKAARPNFDDDGGTLKGCIAERTDDSPEPAESGRAPLTIKITHVQEVPASDAHPAGQGVLATMHRAGEKPYRYVLRLVKEGSDQWKIEQTSDVNDRFAHTADPVAPVLAQYS
ncbi:hypothetical protein [Streptomyces venezuelae]|uniref:hypothetical protein n=1 Tax=Streptomyces venezuelae TaxID=54571 RepID=UPI003423B20E